MRETLKRQFPIHFDPGKKLFQIIVHMSDAPGSMSAILDELGKRVNLVGVTSYTLSDGTAMFSAFAEALSGSESAESIKAAVSSLKATLEAEVREGQDGLLVDTFHTGLRVGAEEYLLVRRDGISGVFEHLVKTFGTGGEVMLFEEGKALGAENANSRVRELGVERVVASAGYIGRALAAQGWGVPVTTSSPESRAFEVTVTDCFECAGKGSIRKRCDFVRGFFEGSTSVTRGSKVNVQEVSCTLRGDKNCVFSVSL